MTAPLVPLVTSSDGPRIVVNDLIKNPLVIPTRILEVSKDQFIADAVLRNAGPNASGVAQFYKSSPLFADTGTAIRSEGAEYRVAHTSIGTPMVAASVDRGLGLIITDEDRSRNRIDLTNQKIMQVKNTLVRDWDTAFITALLNSGIQTFAAATAWATSTTLRNDILKGQKLVNNAQLPSQNQNFLQFTADTLIITEDSKFDILTNASFNSGTNVYQGNLASENLQYTGKLPQKLLNLDVLVVRSGGALADGNAIVMERNTVGFISDEEPLQSTPLYRQQERRRWRSDTNRKSIIGIDQPLAAVLITAV